MRTSTLAAILSTAFAGADAYWKGFNVAAQNPNGSCKSQDDWKAAFNKIKSLPGSYDSVRVYAASDCNTLANAVPAAQATGLKILVGVWTEDDAHFDAEKQALLTAIQQYGSDWIAAVSVGSEDLYRKDTTADALATKIYDVRGMIRSVGANQDVGHVDTWTAWVDGANNPVIVASDFVGMDGYPYFQDAAIADAPNVFWKSLDDTRNAVNAVHPGAWVWITETGWPVSGSDYGAAHPSVENAQSYWKQVLCGSFAQAHTFVYIDVDYQASPSFGVVGSDGNTLYDLTC